MSSNVRRSSQSGSPLLLYNDDDAYDDAMSIVREEEEEEERRLEFYSDAAATRASHAEQVVSDDEDDRHLPILDNWYHRDRRRLIRSIRDQGPHIAFDEPLVQPHRRLLYEAVPIDWTQDVQHRVLPQQPEDTVTFEPYDETAAAPVVCLWTNVHQFPQAFPTYIWYFLDTFNQIYRQRYEAYIDSQRDLMCGPARQVLSVETTLHIIDRCLLHFGYLEHLVAIRGWLQHNDEYFDMEGAPNWMTQDGDVSEETHTGSDAESYSESADVPEYGDDNTLDGRQVIVEVDDTPRPAGYYDYEDDGTNWFELE